MTALFLVFVLFLCGFLYSHPTSHKKLRAFVSHLLPKTTIVVVPTREKNYKKEITMINKAELRRVFSTFDSNGDGFLTEQELSESLGRLGINTNNTDLANMVKDLDSNGDGLLDIDEFSELYNSIGGRQGVSLNQETGDNDGKATGCEEADEEEDMKEAFDVFDDNGDGQITMEELEMVLESLGLKQGMSAGSCRDMIRKVDVDGDGKVSFEEFKRMMKSGKLF